MHFGNHFGVLGGILGSLGEAWGRTGGHFWPCKMEANFGTKIGASPAKPRRDARWPSRAFWRKEDNPARLHPRKGGGRIVTAEPGHRPPLFFVSKVENAWWKLGAPLRSSGVRSLVRIALFSAATFFLLHRVQWLEVFFHETAHGI